jgi:hypothetical protein
LPENPTKDDLDYWESVLSDLIKSYKALHAAMGVTPVVIKLMDICHRVKIKALETALRESEEMKNASVETSTDATVIFQFADQQLELEKAKADYIRFQITGEMFDQE